MAGNSPAFQFYTKEWLSSRHIMMMTPAQEGAYIRLLAIEWEDEDCSLPDDDTQLAILSRLGEGWLKDGCPLVRECFIPHPTKPGFLVNKRLLIERSKQAAWRAKSASGGRKSAKVRSLKKPIKQGSLKGGSKLVATKRQPKGNIAFAFASALDPSSMHTPKGPSSDQGENKFPSTPKGKINSEGLNAIRDEVELGLKLNEK